MKTTLVLAALLAATPAFAQYGSTYSRSSNGATMQDYRLGPHQTTRQHQPLRMQASPTHHPARTGGGSHGYNQANHHTGTNK